MKMMGEEVMRRLLAATLIAGVLAFGASPATAQETLPPTLQTTLAEAAAECDQALLDAVTIAVEENPDLAQAIVDEAILLNPALEEESVLAAIAVDDEVQIAAAEESPAVGAGTVAAGVVGLAAVGAGGSGRRPL